MGALCRFTPENRADTAPVAKGREDERDRAAGSARQWAYYGMGPAPTPGVTVGWAPCTKLKVNTSESVVNKGETLRRT